MAERQLAFTVQGSGADIQTAIANADRHPGLVGDDEIHPSAAKLIEACEAAVLALAPALGPAATVQFSISGEATNASRGNVRADAGDYVSLTVATLRPKGPLP